MYKVTTNFVNNTISVNFNQEYVTIILAKISILLYLYLLIYIFDTVHVKFMF